MESDFAMGAVSGILLSIVVLLVLTLVTLEIQRRNYRREVQRLFDAARLRSLDQDNPYVRSVPDEPFDADDYVRPEKP